MFELFYNDLTPNAQERLKAFVGINDPSELNWDTFPLVTFERAEQEAQLELPIENEPPFEAESED